MDCIHVSFLVVIRYGSYTSCYHWGKFCEGCIEHPCTFLCNFFWICNYFKIESWHQHTTLTTEKGKTAVRFQTNLRLNFIPCPCYEWEMAILLEKKDSLSLQKDSHVAHKRRCTHCYLPFWEHTCNILSKKLNERPWKDSALSFSQVLLESGNHWFQRKIFTFLLPWLNKQTNKQKHGTCMVVSMKPSSKKCIQCLLSVKNENKWLYLDVCSEIQAQTLETNLWFSKEERLGGEMNLYTLLLHRIDNQLGPTV